MFFLYIVVICAFFALYCVIRRLSYGLCRSSQHLVGKVAVITGSNIGIGFANAKDFAERGATVILACRDEERGNKARDAIITSTGNQNVHFMQLDLSSFESIKEFAKKFQDLETRLDILVNNAGNVDMPITKTEDGLLLGMQVNYFGPFLLTNLLLPMLKKSAPSRIVNVASTAHKIGKVNLENLNEGVDGIKGQLQIYANAKLCTVLMTVELARRLEGTGVTVNALCPGFVDTNILNKIRSPIVRYLMKMNGKLTGKNCLEGAQTQIYLAVSSEVKNISGGYFTECKQRKLKDIATDPNMAKKLWDVTKLLVKLKE